jgi:predicted nucleic acid-binding protein
MKKIFLDTNIIIDLFAKREPFYNAAANLFSMADRKEIDISVSALTIANTNYILLKYLKPEDTKNVLRKIRLITKVISLDTKIIDLSLYDKDFKDFEDALQYYSALENNIDVIITRNLKDFQKSKLPVMTAEQFFKSN